MRELPTDVVRLVIAAREVVYEMMPPVHLEQQINELDRAVEAFADRVPWDNEPSDELA